MKNLSLKTTGIILTIVAFSFMAIGDVTTKALTSYYNTFAVGYYLNLLTITFLIPVILYNGGFKQAFQTESLKFHILRSFFMLGVFVCIIYALGTLPMAKTYTIIFTMPFILNILAMVILKEKISGYRWLTIIAAFIGVLIALRPGIVPLNTGAIAALGCAFFIACATITVKHISPNDKWLSFICYPMLVQTIPLGFIVYLQGAPLLPAPSSTTLMWLTGGGLAFTIGLSLLPQAIKRIDASIFGCLLYISFIWGTIYGYFIFGDAVDLWTLAGAVIIISSGLFLIYREKIEDSKLLNTD
ncbi:MAG: DMT family transporter [Alphaproteobacteria bacterium]|nr:DMT family transporter [Alphaproteobacteria bacterium]